LEEEYSYIEEERCQGIQECLVRGDDDTCFAATDYNISSPFGLVDVSGEWVEYTPSSGSRDGCINVGDAE
jgi:hypothetical protein